jgi:hypothetical protein
MGVYTDSGSGVPSTLVTNSDTGTILYTAGTSGVQTANINGSTGVVLYPGWHWLAFVADATGASVYSMYSLNSTFVSQCLLGAASANPQFVAAYTTGVYVALTFGALPSSFGTASYSAGTDTPYIVAGF